MSNHSSNFGSWETLDSVKVNDFHTVVKYRSPETGLELVHAQIDGPFVHAYCIIAHRCQDNCGIPHVLQHLIWRGSKKFSHVGLFPRIANKCITICPDIRIAKDHSCYQFTSAGKHGFSMFLPVFFDHIFNPLCQEAAFITEVYHLGKDGWDGGACFNAMKAEENDPDKLTTLAILQKAFGLKSGYTKNHKGISSVFRSQCNLEKVRQFHDQFYHASNCCLAVIGDIEKEDLFATLTPILHHLLKSHRVKPTWTKPWADEVEGKFLETTFQEVPFPYSFIERPVATPYAHIKVGFLGPASTDNLNLQTALRLVLEYLKGQIYTAVMNAAGPSCHSKIDGMASLTPSVGFTIHPLKQCLITIDFSNIPLDLIPTIPQLLRKVMIREMKRNTFKIRRMAKIIVNLYHKELSDMENGIQEQIVAAVIPDFLYSTQESSVTFEQRINSVYSIHHFLNKNEEFWKQVIEACILDVNWTSVVALPSQELFDKHQSEMMERVAWRLENDNVKYTKRWTNRLRIANKLLSKPPPIELVNKYPFPNSESVGLIKILRQDNPLWANDTLCNLYVDDINTNYAYLTIIMDTSDLTIDQRKYLILFAEAILHAPYMDKCEKFHAYRESQKKMRQDLLKCETCFGLKFLENQGGSHRFSCGSYSHLLCLRIQVDIAKVKEGFFWAQTLLWSTKWQGERLREVATKLVKEAEELQTRPEIVAKVLLTDSLYYINNNPRCLSLVRQKAFLRQVIEELTKSSRKVFKMLESIRSTLLRPENMTVHLAASLPRMEFHLTENPDARFAISELFKTSFKHTNWNWESETKRLSNTADSTWMKSPDYIAKLCAQLIYPMPNISEACLVQVAPCLKSYADSEYPLVLLAIEYFLQQPDGPLFKEIVQTGFANGLNIRLSPLESLVYFELQECPDLSVAYTRVYDVIAMHLTGKNRDSEEDASEDASCRWDSYLLQSAKCSIIFKLAQRESTPLRMSLCSLAGYFNGLTADRSRQTMDAIARATMKQVQNVANKYLGPLFLRPNTCSACVQTERIYDIINEFMQLYDKDMSLVPPLDQSIWSTFNY